MEVLKTAGRRLPSLSALCTQIFETDVLFASLPNRGTIAALEIELNALLARNPPPERRDQINEALSQLRQTSEDLNEIERIQGGEITSEDIVRFNSALQENLFFSATLGATLENIGEAAGGIALEMLPTELNPAVFVSTVLSNAATGAVLSHAALSKLLPMIPAHIREKIERLPVRVATTALLTLAYYYFLGPYVGDFGYYSVGLIFNYLGMCAFGTQETLPDYARKMTPSMIVYNGAFLALNFYGAPFAINIPISFYLSHVAYNAEVYKDMIRGRLISFPERTFTEGLSRLEVGVARERFVKAYLNKLLISQAGASLPSELSFPLQALTTAPGFRERLLAATLQIPTFPLQALTRTPDLQGRLTTALFANQHLFSPLFSSLDEQLEKLDTALTTLKTRIGSPEFVLLARELNEFFRLMQTPQWERNLAAYKAELMRSVQRSSRVEELDPPTGPPAPPQLTAMRQRMLREVFAGSGIPEGLLDRMTDPLAVVDEKLHTDLKPIADSLEETVKSSLYPLFATSDEASACATETLNLLMSLFIARCTTKTATLNVDHLLTMRGLTDDEKSLFMRNISTLMLKMRLPSERPLTDFLLRTQL